jgi:hypothetical protein
MLTAKEEMALSCSEIPKSFSSYNELFYDTQQQAM